MRRRIQAIKVAEFDDGLFVVELGVGGVHDVFFHAGEGDKSQNQHFFLLADTMDTSHGLLVELRVPGNIGGGFGEWNVSD